MYVPEYPKINGLYKRDDKGNFTEEFSDPAFEYLYYNDWIGTEKIDGTNIRISWSPYEKPEIRGRSDRAQIPEFLLEKVQTIVNAMDFNMVFGDRADQVVLYGEGYGNRIQKIGSQYLPDSNDFILFDVWIDGWWMRRVDVLDFGRKLGVNVVPQLFAGTLFVAEKIVKNGFFSNIVADDFIPAEGLVLTPKVPLFDRRGKRIITKLKTKDYQ